MVENLSTCSDWQTGRPWMRLGTEDMPLSPYQSLTITREVEELIEEEYFKDVTLLSEPLTLEKEIPGSNIGVNLIISVGTMPPPPTPSNWTTLWSWVEVSFCTNHSWNPGQSRSILSNAGKSFSEEYLEIRKGMETHHVKD